MSAIAMWLGYAVLTGLAALCLASVLLLAWAYFPARFDWRKNSPSYLHTPSQVLSLDRFIGLNSRRKPKWFFGLIIFGNRKPPKIATYQAFPRSPAPTNQQPRPRAATITKG